MNISIEEKKIEAIRRMREFALPQYAINSFEYHNNKIFNDGYYTIPKIVTDTDALNKIEKFEKEYNALVYFVMEKFILDENDYKKLNKIHAYFYVSDNTEEWKFFPSHIVDKENFYRRKYYGYEYNYNYPELSTIKPINIVSWRIEYGNGCINNIGI